jgi:prepilin-type N-terminal cleavage/methylation domain-containing protein
MKQRGFSLLEILIALAIVGLLLVAMNAFVFSMGELWGRNADVRLFDQHVRAVTRFMQRELRAAVLPPYATANATPIGIQQITPASGAQDNLLTFELTAGSRILTWPDVPLPEVVCSLQVRPGEGLILLWHSRLEMNFNTDAPRELVLTPFVTAMAYDYYDTDFNRWTTETILRRDSTGNPVTPQRLRLTFTYGKMHRDSVIAVYPTPQGLPNP